MKVVPIIVTAAAVLVLLHVVSDADEPVTFENVLEPEPNRPDEPLAESFSAARAARFLDSAALAWQKTRDCMTCHTNYLYLVARPSLGADGAAHAAVRRYAEDLVTGRWETKGPRWPAEVVMTAAVLALNDAATTDKLHPVTRQALDRMWTVQRDDGGFDWLDCDWPPMESDDYFGVPMAALAVGVAPEDYAETLQAQKGLAAIRSYLTANPPPSLHHKAIVMWASLHVDGLMTERQRQTCADEMLVLARDDGGWSLATLGNWPREDGSPQDLESSDGYGTGFVIFMARQAGVPATDPRLQRGVAWLKSHQRQSGRWFTRSLFKDNHHFLSHAGTAYAVMALAACDALEAEKIAAGE